MNYKIYTDGSTKRNGKDGSIGGYAFVVVDNRGVLVDAYAQTNIENTTNNRMELTAILAALFMYQKRMRTSKDEGAYITLYSDSEYALKCLFRWNREWASNGWLTKTGTEVKNKDLIKPFYDKYWGKYLDNIAEGKSDSWRNFEYVYVPGHSNIYWNELADRLAAGQLTVEEALKNEGRY